jgi:CzcA family heavy metal efflux pump
MMQPKGLQAGLIAFAIRFRGIVVALAGVVLIYGLYALAQAKYDVYPEFAPPQVAIQTEASGLTAEQVEILVTQPIENNLNGSPGLLTMRSTSIQGLSVITITFDPASDIYLDRQFVAERLAVAAGELPANVRAPAMTPLTSATGTVLVAGLTSKTKTLMDLRTMADWTVRPRLLAVPGVAKVAVFGGDVKTLQIQVHPDQLIRFGIGMNDVLLAARRASGVRGAGFIETANQRVTFQTEGQSLTAEELSRVVLKNEGSASVTLGNVATVTPAPEPAIGGATIEGEPAVEIVVSSQYGANTMEVTERVEAALAELAPVLQRDGIFLRSDIFRPANFIATATGNVGFALIFGGFLVSAVVFYFLFDVRSAVVSCIAIPLSLLAAVIVLERFGAALNTMSLGGLAIAIGVVVDDAIIDVENILRRLRENARLSQPRPLVQVILDACLEVRSAVVYATFAVILLVLPVLSLTGIAGRLFAPLGAAYLLAVLASLVVALTVTPALSMMLIARDRMSPDEPPAMIYAKSRYREFLDKVFERPRTLVVVAIALAASALAAIPFLTTAFVPELKEGHFIVHMSAVPGTSISESMRMGGMVARALHEIPEVRLVAQRTGRAELADDTWGTHYSEFDVDLVPLEGEEGEFIMGDIRNVLSRFPGVNFAVKPFLTERLEETLSGFTASVTVNIIGSDLDLLDDKAEEVAQVLSGIAGATDVQVQSPLGMPQLTINLRKADLLRWGLDPVGVLDLVRTAYEGETVGQLYEGNRAFNIMVILDRASRQSLTAVENIPVRTPSGAYVRLKQIAGVHEATGRYQVSHDGAQRLQTVTANVADGGVSAFVERAKAAVARIEMPPGMFVRFGGAAEAQVQSQRDLLFNSLLAVAGIVLLLSIVTRNANNLVLVLVNLPFALIGGVIGVFALGGILSLGAMVGFITLFGITLRNSILMIAHYEHLVAVEGASWNLETAIRGALDRVTPIVMTSLVTGLGVLPLAFGLMQAGHEIDGPMAVVILGGLVTSMILNLLVLPVLALHYGRFDLKERAVEAAPLTAAGFGAFALAGGVSASLADMEPAAEPHRPAVPRQAPVTGILQRDIEPARGFSAMPRPVRAPWSSEVAVRVEGITKTFGRIHALDNVNFTIRSGEVLGLIGPNGAGKTTLFEAVAGIEPADAGSVFFGEKPTDPEGRSSKMFYVPDGIAPWPDQPVSWVLEYGLGFYGGRREMFDAVVADLALEKLMPVPIRALSKGQRKRTLLALGLLAPQPILLIDEPFEGLDLRQSREAGAALRKHLTPERTFFLSIHQISDAAKVCDRFVLLSGGRVIQEGNLEDLSVLAAERLGRDPTDFEEVFLALTRT